MGAAAIRVGAAELARRVRRVLDDERLPIVLGGDCALLLGVFSALGGGAGLCFVDGHADFYDGDCSPTGEAADMDLAILTGHGPTGLLGPGAGEPAVEPSRVALLGHRPDSAGPDTAFENARIDPRITALSSTEISARGPARAGEHVAELLGDRELWLHLDLDVLDERVLPAVSYPQPLGIGWDELRALIDPVVRLPGLLGVSIADFNPDKDRDGGCAARVTDELVAALDPLAG